MKIPWIEICRTAFSIVVVICTTWLAIHFDNWWIILSAFLLAVLMS